MKNKKKVFDKKDLELFLNQNNLILKENAMSRISGGKDLPTYKNYSESTFVNHA